MATFNAKISFKGLCAFVPRDISAGDDLSFCVVLPNAWHADLPCKDVPRTSVDGSSLLRPHRPFLSFPVPRLMGLGGLGDVRGIYFLEGKRLCIRPQGSSLPKCQLLDSTGFASITDFISEDKLALVSVADAVLAPDPCKVGCQVIFQNGDVTAPAGDVTWVFDNYLLGKKPGSKRLNTVDLTIPGIDSLVLDIYDLITNELIDSFNFDDFKESDEPIKISNLCLTDPLQWDNPLPVDQIEDDIDFRWHYEIVDNTSALAKELGGLPCPIPRVDRSDDSNGNGLNCFPKLFGSVNFNPSIWEVE